MEEEETESNNKCSILLAVSVTDVGIVLMNALSKPSLLRMVWQQ
jgi:hypothetical protein